MGWNSRLLGILVSTLVLSNSLFSQDLAGIEKRISELTKENLGISMYQYNFKTKFFPGALMAIGGGILVSSSTAFKDLGVFGPNPAYKNGTFLFGGIVVCLGSLGFLGYTSYNVFTSEDRYEKNNVELAKLRIDRVPLAEAKRKADEEAKLKAEEERQKQLALEAERKAQLASEKRQKEIDREKTALTEYYTEYQQLEKSVRAEIEASFSDSEYWDYTLETDSKDEGQRRIADKIRLLDVLIVHYRESNVFKSFSLDVEKNFVNLQIERQDQTFKLVFRISGEKLSASNMIIREGFLEWNVARDEPISILLLQDTLIRNSQRSARAKLLIEDNYFVSYQ